MKLQRKNQINESENKLYNSEHNFIWNFGDCVYNCDTITVSPNLDNGEKHRRFDCHCWRRPDNACSKRRLEKESGGVFFLLEPRSPPTTVLHYSLFAFYACQKTDLWLWRNTVFFLKKVSSSPCAFLESRGICDWKGKSGENKMHFPSGNQRKRKYLIDKMYSF